MFRPGGFDMRRAAHLFCFSSLLFASLLAQTAWAQYGSSLQGTVTDQSGAITSRQVEQLPQFGRDPYELLRLAPGVFGDGARNGTGQAQLLPNGAGPGGSNNSI
jgi:hypothetical protein